MYYIYILQCSDGSLYTGITNNLDRRMKMHTEGKGSKYVRAKLPFSLVYKEKVENKSSALKREIEIKKMDRVSKLLLFK